jgi:hypothetical protein
MTYRPSADTRQMLEQLASEDKRPLTWELNWLIEQEWTRRGKPPLIAGGEEDSGTN